MLNRMHFKTNTLNIKEIPIMFSIRCVQIHTLYGAFSNDINPGAHMMVLLYVWWVFSFILAQTSAC